jgi:hypothetical protein
MSEWVVLLRVVKHNTSYYFIESSFTFCLVKNVWRNDKKRSHRESARFHPKGAIHSSRSIHWLLLIANIMSLFVSHASCIQESWVLMTGARSESTQQKARYISVNLMHYEIINFRKWQKCWLKWGALLAAKALCCRSSFCSPSSSILQYRRTNCVEMSRFPRLTIHDSRVEQDLISRLAHHCISFSTSHMGSPWMDFFGTGSIYLQDAVAWWRDGTFSAFPPCYYKLTTYNCNSNAFANSSMMIPLLKCLDICSHMLDLKRCSHWDTSWLHQANTDI